MPEPLESEYQAGAKVRLPEIVKFVQYKEDENFNTVQQREGKVKKLDSKDQAGAKVQLPGIIKFAQSKESEAAVSEEAVRAEDAEKSEEAERAKDTQRTLQDKKKCLKSYKTRMKAKLKMAKVVEKAQRVGEDSTLDQKCLDKIVAKIQELEGVNKVSDKKKVNMLSDKEFLRLKLLQIQKPSRLYRRKKRLLSIFQRNSRRMRSLVPV